jgi:hypothetical protein
MQLKKISKKGIEALPDIEDLERFTINPMIRMIKAT